MELSKQTLVPLAWLVAGILQRSNFASRIPCEFMADDLWRRDWRQMMNVSELEVDDKSWRELTFSSIKLRH